MTPFFNVLNFKVPYLNNKFTMMDEAIKELRKITQQLKEIAKELKQKNYTYVINKDVITTKMPIQELKFK